MEFIALLVIVTGLSWIFRRTIKEWANRAEETSHVTSAEIKVNNHKRYAKLKSEVSDELVTDCAEVKSKLDALNML